MNSGLLYKKKFPKSPPNIFFFRRLCFCFKVLFSGCHLLPFQSNASQQQ